MNIEYFKNFETNDFVEDKYFRRWVLDNDKSLNFFWEVYLRKYPQKKEALMEAKYLLAATQSFYEQGPNHIDDNFRNQLQEIYHASSAKMLSTSESSNRKMARRKFALISVAAIVATLAMATIYWFCSSDNLIQYATGNGEWETVELPDGSIVELNANSELSINPNWNEGEDRKVWLKGEAFFEVKKKESTGAKFLVTTSDLTVEVLGTAFSVNTRNSQTEVFLEEGKISLDLKGAEEKERIEPGEFIAYSEVQGKVTHRYKKTEEIQANWKDGVLKLDDVSTAEIISEIEAIYGMEVIVNSKSVLTKVSSVAIPVNSIELAISILKRALNVKIEYSKDKIYIG